MSEALFERAAEGRHQGRSAGTTAGDRVHPEVVEVMNELGIDLSGRVPKLLDTATPNGRRGGDDRLR
jgi:arsenate reductase